MPSCIVDMPVVAVHSASMFSGCLPRISACAEALFVGLATNAFVQPPCNCTVLHPTVHRPDLEVIEFAIFQISMFLPCNCGASGVRRASSFGCTRALCKGRRKAIGCGGTWSNRGLLAVHSSISQSVALYITNLIEHALIR